MKATSLLVVTIIFIILNNKVKLTDLGIYILETIKGGNKTVNNKIPKVVEGLGCIRLKFSSHLDLQVYLHLSRLLSQYKN
jgi:hypothetical protein